MKIHLRAISASDSHVRFTVFVNGANCGELCMRVSEAHAFHQVVANGCRDPLDDFVSSGHWVPGEEREKERVGP